jgi:hypothetical protein
LSGVVGVVHDHVEDGGMSGREITGWERELIDPDYRPPAFYFTITPEFAASEYGFPTPLPGAETTAYDPSP